MKPLPITLGLFTSTRGHWDRKTDWRLTLRHWDRQVPLSLFNLVAHVKVSPNEQGLGAQMAEELRGLGFHVLTTTGVWKHGGDHGTANHGFNYLLDQQAMARCDEVYKRPYFMLLEDDNLAVTHGVALDDLLAQSCQMLERNREILTTRLINRMAYDGGVNKVPHPTKDPRFFWSPYSDYQCILMRSVHFDILGQTLEKNPQACQQVQCEALWAAILSNFSRSPHRHLVWEPDHVENIHIGCPQEEHEQLVARYNLS